MRTPGLVLLALAAGCTGPTLGPAEPPPAGSPPGTPDPGNPMKPPPSMPPGTMKPPAPYPPSDDETAPACTDPGPTPMRRLTRQELDNTLSDLLGFAVPEVGQLPRWGGGDFDRLDSTHPVSSLDVELLARMAEAAAERALARLPELLPCAPADEGCAGRFIAAFGRRAFRRPLDEEELRHYGDLFVRGERRGKTFAEGARWVIEAMLQAAPFLYHVERGAPGGDAVVRMGPHEIAERLSYFFWETLPDARLSAAADAGQLGTAQEIEREAKRLYADPRARKMVAHFHRQWLRLDLVEELAKEVPPFDAALQASLPASAERFADHVFWEDGGRLRTLLTTSYLFTDAQGQPALYGLRLPTGPGLEKQESPAGQRAGLLTQPAFLASHAHEEQSSPIRRGLIIVNSLLHYNLPLPPAEVPPLPPFATEKLTTRERIEQATGHPSCAPCHRIMNGPGFALESFDGLGIYRTHEQGKPVDTSGILVTAADGEIPFSGFADLATTLAGLREVQDGVVKEWFRFAFGREETKEDACVIEELQRRFVAAGGDMTRVPLALVEMPTFTSRRAIQGVTP